MANLAIGDVRNGFEVISERISRGAMAQGYRAKKNGRVVYLKQYLSPRPLIDWYDGYVEYQKELKRRIQTSDVKDFSYEFIDFFEATRPPRNNASSKNYYQVFEWVDGGKDLSHIIAELNENASAYTWKQRLIWAKVIMGSIAKLHEQKIAHIDLKPENLILIPADIGAGYRLKLIDMDFSILTDDEAPWHGKSGYIGTPGWLSPEHLQGQKPDKASDVFTCGLILYDLLGQGNPYKNSGTDDKYKENVLAHSAPEITLFQAMPKGNDSQVIDVLFRCLSVDPSNRPTANDVNLALNAKGYVADEVVEIVTITEPEGVDVSGDMASSEDVDSSISCLELHFGGKTIKMKITTILNMRLVKEFGEDHRVWDKENQMTLKHISGVWSVIHNSVAPNETLLNSHAVTSAQELKTGDTLAVGKECKGIIKMPMTVKIN